MRTHSHGTYQLHGFALALILADGETVFAENSGGACWGVVSSGANVARRGLDTTRRLRPM